MSQVSLQSLASGSDYLNEPHLQINSHRPNPFATPPLSSPNTRAPSIKSTTSSRDTLAQPNEWFRSRRTPMLTKENRREIKRQPHEKWLWILPTIGLVVGLGIAGYLVYTGISKSPYTYRLVLDEDFSSPTLNPKIWTYQQEVGGFGNGEFEQTTASTENVYIKDGMLYIQPTLQDASLISHNATINLTAMGTCTSDYWANCITSTNTTNGTIVQPTLSGRLDTKLGASITYGRVEITAKISQGDWLWPAIWMMPVTDTYGPWPASGEIDIMESRGNNYTYAPGGNNIVSSALHYGPDPLNDAYITTHNTERSLHSQYGDEFHTYGLEWTPEHIFTYIDSRLQQVMYIKLDEPFWTRGNFPAASPNGTLNVNPWAGVPGDAAPFNKPFYLILNVAVGGTNGWFPDGFANKPWSNASPYAKTSFYNDHDQWQPTWKDNSAMIIKRVQMWQQE